MAHTANVKNERSPVLSNRAVDRAVNAVLTAMTSDLDRPFIAGGRNVRAIIQGWCPLSQGPLPEDVRTFRASYVTAHLLDRYFYTSELNQKDNLEAEAHSKFVENLKRGSAFDDGPVTIAGFSKLSTVLVSASREIAHILGEFDHVEWFEECTHGPNSTLGVPLEESFLDRKLRCIEGTVAALDLFKDYLTWNTTLAAHLEHLHREDPLQVKIVSGNKLSFVPKKFDRLRTMMIEPTINQFFQQGLGKLIASRLKRFGNVDMETQPQCHANLVKVITAHDLPIATVDWSEASDRIWLSLCQMLLPPDWFSALEGCRSPCTVYSKGCNYAVHELTMAGSMGCGFTSALQTLLFLCLLRALAREGDKEQFVSVFGDDCICDSDLLPEIEWLADQLSWKINATKSFGQGGFRESCGVDAYHGEDCRPFFIERPSDLFSKTAVAAWSYGVYNQAKKACACDTPNLDAWLVNHFETLGLGRILYVPPRFSVNAGVQIEHPDFCIKDAPSSVRGSEREGYVFRAIGTSSSGVKVDPRAYYLWKLMGKGVPRSFRKGRVTLEEDSDVRVDPDAANTVSGKRACYATRKRYVHTWHYWSD